MGNGIQEKHAHPSQEADGRPGRKERRKQEREAAREGGRGSGSEIPVWEWIVAALGAVLVIGSIGFMLYNSLSGEESPPDIVIHADSIHPVQSGYLVQIRATNRGGLTAAGVTVEGTLRNGTERIETSETVLDFVPAESERRGGLFFTEDPRGYRLELRAKGYEQP